MVNVKSINEASSQSYHLVTFPHEMHAMETMQFIFKIVLLIYFVCVWGGGLCVQQLDVESQFPVQGLNPGHSGESAKS